MVTNIDLHSCRFGRGSLFIRIRHSTYTFGGFPESSVFRLNVRNCRLKGSRLCVRVRAALSLMIVRRDACKLEDDKMNIVVQHKFV